MNIQQLPLENQYRILLSLPPQYVLKLCQTNHYFASLCNNVDFWIYRAYEEFGVTADVFNNTNLPPRLRYLQLLSTVGNKCVAGSERFVEENTCVFRTARDNDRDSLDYFLKNKNNDVKIALVGAAEGNNFILLKDILKIISQSDTYFATELRLASSSSILNNNLEMFKYLSEVFQSAYPQKYEKYLKKSLRYAIMNDSISIIRYINSLGIDDPNTILIGAAYANNMDLIQEAIKNGATDYIEAIPSTIMGNNIELLDYFLGIIESNNNLFIAAINNNIYPRALNLAARLGNLKIFIHIVNIMKKLRLDIINNPDDLINTNLTGKHTNIKLITYILDTFHYTEPLSVSILYASWYDKYNNILKILIDRSMSSIDWNNKGDLYYSNGDYILSHALWNSIYNNQPINRDYLLSIGAKLYPHLSVYLNVIFYKSKFGKSVLRKIIREGLLSESEIVDLITKQSDIEVINFLEELR